ncbi:DUF3263 domain-containing protein [Microbacterium sp. 1P06AB]|uniref:DUF3263 domain-containing protein n=1 Tax=Microbacterium sp. 1P06AB TaxID=3132289 RepID=UPI0039A6A6B5
MLSDATLLDFEARHPGHPGHKQQAIETELGITAARYYQLAIRAAQSLEGMAHDPITARRLLQ